jgi:pyruvate-formate lyase-activating enzyme
MDTEPRRYRDFCSDLAAFDLKAHDDEPLKLVCEVRDWRQCFKQAYLSGVHW